jgi:hypothetical protein
MVEIIEIRHECQSSSKLTPHEHMTYVVFSAPTNNIRVPEYVKYV